MVMVAYRPTGATFFYHWRYLLLYIK